MKKKIKLDYLWYRVLSIEILYKIKDNNNLENYIMLKEKIGYKVIYKI